MVEIHCHFGAAVTRLTARRRGVAAHGGGVVLAEDEYLLAAKGYLPQSRNYCSLRRGVYR